MDVVAGDSKKGGTRGGRANFTWESVNNDERQYYLGNSVAKRSNSRNNTSQPDFDWYNRAPPPSTSASASVTLEPTLTTSNPQSITNDLLAVRRKEEAMMEQMIVGRSFSDAVRSALTESIGSGVDDEGTRIDTAAAAARRAMRRREKHEKAQRKEMRRRVRELRRVRRAERNKRRERQQNSQNSQHDSSESERESLRSRMQEGTNRRRRRGGRDNATRRKRPEWSSTSDSDDSDGHRSRRQRLR